MNTKQKKIIIITSSLIAVFAIGSFIIKAGSEPQVPDMREKSHEEIHDYFKSEDFNSLDHREKRTVARQVFKQKMEKSVQDYFDLPTNQRTAHLDKLIDQMEQRKKDFQNDPNRPKGLFGPPPDRSDGATGDQTRDRQRQRDRGDRRQRKRQPDRMRSRSENMNPATRAMMTEFRQAMQQRRTERGITGPGPR
jgi:hypothetical protein